MALCWKNAPYFFPLTFLVFDGRQLNHAILPLYAPIHFKPSRIVVSCQRWVFFVGILTFRVTIVIVVSFDPVRGINIIAIATKVPCNPLRFSFFCLSESKICFTIACNGKSDERSTLNIFTIFCPVFYIFSTLSFCNQIPLTYQSCT